MKFAVGNGPHLLREILHEYVVSDPLDDLVQALIGLEVRQRKWFFAAELLGVFFHDLEACATARRPKSIRPDMVMATMRKL